MQPRLPPPRRDRIPWRIVAIVAVALSFAAGVYYFFYGKKSSAEQTRLTKERRALQSQVAVPYDGIRARVEKWTVSFATSPYTGDYVDESAKTLAWRTRPSLYLRERITDASTENAVHAAAKVNAFDGLSSCLLAVEGGKGPWLYGETIARAEMLGSSFMNQVATANDLELRNLAYGLDYYKEHDFPPLREAVTLSEYVTIALDEDPTVPPSPSGDAGIDLRLTVPHPIRVAVYRLNDDKLLLRVRATADVGIVQVQGDPILEAGAASVRQAQALGCAMGGLVVEASGGKGLPSMDEAPSPTPTALPAPSTSSSTAPSAAPSTSSSTVASTSTSAASSTSVVPSASTAPSASTPH